MGADIKLEMQINSTATTLNSSECGTSKYFQDFSSTSFRRHLMCLYSYVVKSEKNLKIDVCAKSQRNKKSETILKLQLYDSELPKHSPKHSPKLLASRRNKSKRLAALRQASHVALCYSETNLHNQTTLLELHTAFYSIMQYLVSL